jgi:hypothetical protein
MPATWLCPSCGRRVPASLQECRCGALRSSAAAVRVAAARRRQTLPRDVLALLVVLVLVVLAGLVALFLPYGPNRLPKILGIVDKPRPAAATPAPQRSPARP